MHEADGTRSVLRVNFDADPDQTRIYSINIIAGYNPHNNHSFNAILPVKLNMNYRIIYKCNNDLGEPDYTQTTNVSTGSTIVVTKTNDDTNFTSPSEDLVFKGWNTQADGNGIKYEAGSNITISGDTILYAMWGDPSTTLTITKEITASEYTNMTKEFNFEIYFFEDDSGTKALASGTTLPYTGGTLAGSNAAAPFDDVLTLGGNGMTKITLLNWQTVTIADVPSDGSVQVIETNANAYNVTFKDSEEPSSEEGYDTLIRAMSSNPRTFDFVNTRKEVSEPGIVLGTYIGILVLAVIGTISLIVFNRRRKRVN